MVGVVFGCLFIKIGLVLIKSGIYIEVILWGQRYKSFVRLDNNHGFEDGVF